MNNAPITVPASQGLNRRRNRAHPVRGDVGASTQATSTNDQACSSQHTSGDAPYVLPGSPAQVLAQGNAWLRFPPALEAQFKAETLEHRRKLQLICGLIGLMAICIGSLNITELTPDYPKLALRNVYWLVEATSLSLIVAWLMPKRWRRNWQVEALTAFSIVSLAVSEISLCMISRVDTTYTHASALVTTVLYACIAARLRFAWALACAISTFVGYVAFVRGATPQQELIVAATTKLMALSYVFVLVANYAFERNERRNWLLRKVQGQQRTALNETAERLYRLSIQDPLTGLFNRRQFDGEVGIAWSMAAQASKPIAMLMIDVDFFKLYNDTYGHPAGDTCLIQVSQALSKVAEAHGGIAARLGGEEFGLLLPSRTLDDAVAVGVALCEGVRSARIEHSASTVSEHVTVSVGAAQLWPAQGGSTQMLVDEADRALYQAKQGGRNRACGADMPTLAQARTVTDTEPQCTAAPSAAPAAGRVEPDAMIPPPESAFVQTLNGGFRTLRFPTEQEAIYIHHNAEHRRKHLAMMTVLGLVIYNLYTLSSRSMFSDVQDNALQLQVWVSLTMLLVAGMTFAMPLTPRLREGMFSLGASTVGALSAWVLSQSHQLTAMAFSVCLVLIPLFSGVAARQPVRFACVPALVTCVALLIFLRPVGALQSLVVSDSVLMIATNTVFALILAYTLEHGARKEWLLSRIEHLQREALQLATRRLHELSMLDPLTGICNRRQFEADFERIWLESLHDQRPLAMLMIDVDFFKLYNDDYGHPAGDRCLKQVAATISQMARECKGIGARMGGEEFGILLPNTSAKQAVELGERMCAAVRQAGIEHRHSKVSGQAVVTVSIGAASLSASNTTGRRNLFAIADDALYQAKSGGRNRVATLPLPLPSAELRSLD